MGVLRTEGPLRALPCLPCPASVLIAGVRAAGLSEGPASPGRGRRMEESVLKWTAVSRRGHAHHMAAPGPSLLSNG